MIQNVATLRRLTYETMQRRLELNFEMRALGCKLCKIFLFQELDGCDLRRVYVCPRWFKATPTKVRRRELTDSWSEPLTIL